MTARPIDRTSGVPAYRQVADDLRRRIGAEFLAGTQLPSERELVETYDVSRPTVRDAIALLRSEGVVTAEHGRGIFVKAPARVHRLARTRLTRAARVQNQSAFLSDAVREGFTPSIAVEIRFEPANDRIAELLAVPPGTETTVRDRIMSADDLPVQLATSYLPRELTRDTSIELADTGIGGSYARLEEAGYKIVHFGEFVRTRMPTADERSALQLGSGVPVIALTRVTHSENRPLEVNDMVLSGERYELAYEWPAE